MNFRTIVIAFLFSVNLIIANRVFASGEAERYHSKSATALSTTFTPGLNVNLTSIQPVITSPFLANLNLINEDVLESEISMEVVHIYRTQSASAKTFYLKASTKIHLILFIGGVGLIGV